MSYCVNCGVELGSAEHACPLCQTPVVNPANPWKEPTVLPYPNRVETIMRHVDLRYFGSLTSLMLLIPALICMLNDLLLHQRITWSAFVAGGLLVVFVAVLLPMIVRKRVLLLLLWLDMGAVLSLLWLVEWGTGGKGWFLHLGLPLTLAFGLVASLLICWFTAKGGKRPPLLSIGLIVYAPGVYTVFINMIVNWYLNRSVLPKWGWYTLIPCLITGTMFFILHRRSKWRESVYKRLFF